MGNTTTHTVLGKRKAGDGDSDLAPPETSIHSKEVVILNAEQSYSPVISKSSRLLVELKEHIQEVR